MNILLAGGTGFLGRHLAQHLESAGHAVFFLSRSRKIAANYFRWNPEANEMEPEALIDKDIIINLSGAGIANKYWTKKYKKTIYASRIQSTKLLVDSVLKLDKPPKLVISGSAIGFYGNRSGTKLTEDNEAGTDFLATVCQDWEKEPARLRQENIPLAILRTGIVLGKGGGSLPKLKLPLKFGLNVLFGTGKQHISWIHIADFCRIVELLIANKLPEGTYNMVSPRPVSQAELNEAIQKHIGRPAIKIRVPAKLIKMLLGEMASLFLGDQFVVPQELRRNNYEFQFDNIDAAMGKLRK